MKVTISAAWMKACGYPERDTTLRVVREFDTAARSQAFGHMYVVDHNGREWTVAHCRLRNQERSQCTQSNSLTGK